MGPLETSRPVFLAATQVSKPANRNFHVGKLSTAPVIVASCTGLSGAANEAITSTFKVRRSVLKADSVEDVKLAVL